MNHDIAHCTGEYTHRGGQPVLCPLRDKCQRHALHVEITSAAVSGSQQSVPSWVYYVAPMFDQTTGNCNLQLTNQGKDKP